MAQQAFNPANNNGVKYVDATAEALRTTSVDAAGSAVSPATAANQTTQNTKLDTISSKLTGAANFANGQVTAGAVSGVLVAARATRRVVTIRNQDAANSAYVGGGTVTSGNGFLLKAGESISIETTAALNCLRATADVSLAYLEIYD
jgi:hypothetical protein